MEWVDVITPIADCLRHRLPLRNQDIHLPQLGQNLHKQCFLLAISVLLRFTAIPQGGPLRGGRITKLARLLTVRGVPTPRSSAAWTHGTVARVLQRTAT